MLSTWGSTFCAPTTPCTLLLAELRAPLSALIRLYPLTTPCTCDRNRTLSTLYTCFLFVSVRICDCAFHPHSLSLASLTRCNEHQGISKNTLCLSYLSLASSPVSAPPRDSLTHSRSLALPALPWVKTYAVLRIVIRFRVRVMILRVIMFDDYGDRHGAYDEECRW